MSRLERSTIIGCLVLCALAVVYAVLVAVAVGQAPDDDPAVLLARTCVSERSWSTSTHDCRAIGEVVGERIRRVYPHLPARSAWRSAIRDLSPTLHGTGTLARPWLRELDPSGARPASWPGGRWSCSGDCPVERRADWLATLDEARRIVEGEVPPVCERPPVSWGSRADVRARERLRRARWVAVDCGPTVNLFGGWVR